MPIRRHFSPEKSIIKSLREEKGFISLNCTYFAHFTIIAQLRIAIAPLNIVIAAIAAAISLISFNSLYAKYFNLTGTQMNCFGMTQHSITLCCSCKKA
jgi:hypothetical protein